jgi:alginate O-acetyltransferase complex protein AlgJ
MTTDPRQPLPAGGAGREAAAMMEIAHTDASPVTVRLLPAFFLAAIVAVPAIEIVLAGATGDKGLGVAWSRLTAMANEIRTAPAVAVTRGLWERTIAANHIALNGLSAFERALEDDSLMARALRPTAQRVMTGLLGAGNERVYPGRDRWLFYRPDVDYLTGRGFLDPAVLERRISATPEWKSLPQPDPLQAIVRFNDDLAARGIALIVMPTPPKPAVHPEKLVGAFDGGDLPANPSLGPLLAQLQARGVLVFNPRDVLTPSGGSPQYLATDTHWRPEAMEAVAEGLARFMAARVRLEPVDDPGYRIERSEVMNVGDTARMLDLPAGADLFPAQSVWLRRVLQADGSLWRSSPQSQVLVLGDSFSNIYALESMAWGTSAGFVEQLSYLLRRPVDRIVQNDDGAFATRAMLQQSPQRLDGKKVVVYQFAERELAFGDWKLLDLVESASPLSTPAP